MSNMIPTNVDTGSVVNKDGAFRDGTFTAGGAVTYLAGTILAKLDADGKYVPYASGGSAGAEVPKAVLTYDLVASGAGDLPIRALVGGQVRMERLIEHGKAAGVDITGVVADKLADYGITAINVSDLSVLDNQ